MDHSPPSSQKGLKRCALRAAVWLAEVLQYMPDVRRLPKRVQAFVEHRLDLLAGLVIHLVFMRSAPQCRPGQRVRDWLSVGRASVRHDVRVHITHSLRATIGGRLRRQLNPRGKGVRKLKARAAAVLFALRNLDSIVARFIRRMKNGLSKRLSAHSRVKHAALHDPAGRPLHVMLERALRTGRAPP